MSQPRTLTYETTREIAPESNAGLLRVVLALALPALVEQIFNFLVGLNDTWLANNLPKDVAPSAKTQLRPREPGSGRQRGRSFE